MVLGDRLDRVYFGFLSGGVKGYWWAVLRVSTFTFGLGKKFATHDIDIL